MFAGLARFAFRYRWAVLIVYLVLLPVAAFVGGGVFEALKPGGYDDPSTQSYKARQQILHEFGIGAADLVPLYTVRGGTVQDGAAKAAIGAALDRVAKDRDVTRVLDLYNTGAAQFVSHDGTRTFAVISLKGDDKAKIDTVHRLKPLLRAEGVTTQFGGEIPVFEAFNQTVEKDLRRAEIVAFPVTAILLVVIFGSLVSAGVPLVLGVFAILFALTAVRLIASITDLSVFALNVITVLGLGLAIDYSLFILNRYREELPERGVEGAIVAAISTTGRAAAFSGVTLAASLVGLFVFPQVFLRSMAIGGIAVAIIAIVLATTLLPALVAVLGSKIDAVRLPWPRRGDEPSSAEGGFWHRVAFGVMRHPVPVAVGVVALLLLLGSPFLKFRPTKQDYRALSPALEARQVSDVLDSQFVPHETTPINVALTADRNLLTAETVGQLFDYVVWLRAVPGITRVDSLFSLMPGQSREMYQSLFTSQDALKNPALAAGLSLFVHDNVTRFSLVSDYAFDAPQAQHQVAEVRSLPAPPRTALRVGGNAADLYDTKASIRDRIPYTLIIIAAATFIVLFLVYGSFTLPLKAMVMNLLSLTAAAGAVVWIFQYGRLADILRYHSLGTLDVTLPILLFGIVFGLSMDYEVLMLSRVREEYVRTGDNTLAVALGLEKTGRLITSAAALLVVVIIAFATSSITVMKSLGVGMALAIAVDATIVRALLVPAAMRLMGHWNWWAPAPMKLLWQRMGFADLEGHVAPQPVFVPALAAAMPAGPTGAGAASFGDEEEPSLTRTVILRRRPQVLAYLVEMQGDEVGRVFNLENDITTIGRSPRNKIVLSDPAVSARHAQILRGLDGGLVIEDRGSSNGTYVNDEEIDGTRSLEENDAILIGSTALQLKIVSLPRPAE